MVKVHCDGGCSGNPGGHTACGIYITDNYNKEVTKFGLYLGKGTNNTAEFGAAIEAFKWLILNGYKNQEIEVFMDSKLVVMIFNGKWKCKKDHLKLLLGQLRSLTSQFTHKIEFTWIPREKNKEADEESTKVLDIIKETL